MLSRNPDVRYKAIQHPNADVWNIHTAMDLDEPYLAELAIQHDNVTEEHLKKGVFSNWWRVRQYSIQHSKCTLEIAMAAFNSDDWNVKWIAVNRFAIDNFEIVDRCLTDSSIMLKNEGRYYLYNYYIDRWLQFRATKNHIYHCLRAMMGSSYL